MTTVIMISNDNSVIISNGEDHDSGRSSGHGGLEVIDSTQNNWSSKSSFDKSNMDSVVEDTSQENFVKNKKQLNNMNPRIKMARKCSISSSQQESDSEEMNNSSTSSSTVSTLSSRTSGVSSGDVSGVSSGSGDKELIGDNLDSVAVQWRNREAANERKFTTLNRNHAKLKSHQVSRAQSFHFNNQMTPHFKPVIKNRSLSTTSTDVTISSPSQFMPSKNSAFHRLGKGDTTSMHKSFVTSTPLGDRGIQGENRQHGEVFSRNRKELSNSKGSMVPSILPMKPLPDKMVMNNYHRGWKIILPHQEPTPGSHCYVHPDGDYFQNTRSLGRRIHCSGYGYEKDADAHHITNSSNYITLSNSNKQHPHSYYDGRHNVKLKPTANDKHVSNAGHSKRKTPSQRGAPGSTPGKIKHCEEVSPINTNYARIYSKQSVYEEHKNPDKKIRTFSRLSETNDTNAEISSDSDYDTIYSSKEEPDTLMPIGSVFPSGCHKHPSMLMQQQRSSNTAKRTLPQPSCLPYNNNNTCYECGKACKCHNISNKMSLSDRYGGGHNDKISFLDIENSSGDSVNLNIMTNGNRTTYSQMEEKKLMSVSKAKSIDGLTALLNKSVISDKEQKVKLNHRLREKILDQQKTKNQVMPSSKWGGENCTSRFPSLSVSKSQILRRHTTYDKKSKAVHIHSWHKQEDEIQRPKSSSLKRSMSRRSASSSRLSLLSKKEENEISITDAQSLDRLSLHSQEDLDEIYFEKYLQSAGRAAGWSKEFDCLLVDKIGLSKFTEFLQKEFSHENIFFWCACEKYRLVEKGFERHSLAWQIMQKHLEAGAVEPVNVDSIARAATSQKLASCDSVDNPPERSLFLSVQRHIYNLMKFDSYPRFLKSDVYKECVRTEMNGGIIGESETIRDSYSRSQACKENLGCQQPKKMDSLKSKRRKSLSFWDNLSSGSKSRESSCNQLQDSLLSTTKGYREDQRKGENEKDGCTLTRVIFPDKATTVVNTNSGESIRSMISRLLEKRNLKLTSFDIFSSQSETPLDLSEDCAMLHCTEVRVEARILFRLELPSHKSIGVKAKRTKSVEDVLSPILQQYGWNISEVEVFIDEDTNEGDRVDLNSNVTVIDNKRLFVVQSNLTKERFWKQTETKISKNDPEMAIYEGLQIMRKGRFEDQRGTDICFEIPEFLRQPSKPEPSVTTKDNEIIDSELF